jgi:hypothetical protein
MFPFTVDIGPSNQVWYFNSTTQNSTNPNSPAATPSHGASSCKTSPTAAIAGGVAGGVISLLLIVLAFWFGIRRGKAAAGGQSAFEEVAPSSPISLPLVAEAVNSNITHRHQPNAGTSIAAGLSQITTTSGVSGSSVVSPQPISIFNQVSMST